MRGGGGGEGKPAPTTHVLGSHGCDRDQDDHHDGELPRQNKEVQEATNGCDGVSNPALTGKGLGCACVCVWGGGEALPSSHLTASDSTVQRAWHKQCMSVPHQQAAHTTWTDHQGQRPSRCWCLRTGE